MLSVLHLIDFVGQTMKDAPEITLQNIRDYIATAYPDHAYDANLLRFAVDRSVSCGTLSKVNGMFLLTSKGEVALKNFEESFARGAHFSSGKKKTGRVHVSARVNQLVHEAFQVLRPRRGGLTIDNIVAYAMKKYPESFSYAAPSFNPGRLIRGIQTHIQIGLEKGTYVFGSADNTYRLAGNSHLSSASSAPQWTQMSNSSAFYGSSSTSDHSSLVSQGQPGQPLGQSFVAYGSHLQHDAAGPDAELVDLISHLRARGFVPGVSIECLSPEGIMLRRFTSLDEVAALLPFPVRGIKEACDGAQKRSSMFGWRYYDENLVDVNEQEASIETIMGIWQKKTEQNKQKKNRGVFNNRDDYYGEDIEHNLSAATEGIMPVPSIQAQNISSAPPLVANNSVSQYWGHHLGGGDPRAMASGLAATESVSGGSHLLAHAALAADHLQQQHEVVSAQHSLATGPHLSQQSHHHRTSQSHQAQQHAHLAQYAQGHHLLSQYSQMAPYPPYVHLQPYAHGYAPHPHSQASMLPYSQISALYAQGYGAPHGHHDPHGQHMHQQQQSQGQQQQHSQQGNGQNQQQGNDGEQYYYM